MKQSLSDRLIRYISAFGDEVESRSQKYRVFKLLSTGDHIKYYHVGRHGSVRVSASGKITESYSVGYAIRARMALWEQEIDSALWSALDIDNNETDELSEQL